MVTVEGTSRSAAAEHPTHARHFVHGHGPSLHAGGCRAFHDEQPLRGEISGGRAQGAEASRPRRACSEARLQLAADIDDSLQERAGPGAEHGARAAGRHLDEHVRGQGQPVPGRAETQAHWWHPNRSSPPVPRGRPAMHRDTRRGVARSKKVRAAAARTGQLRQWMNVSSSGQLRSPATPIFRQHSSIGAVTCRSAVVSRVMRSLAASDTNGRLAILVCHRRIAPLRGDGRQRARNASAWVPSR